MIAFFAIVRGVVPKLRRFSFGTTPSRSRHPS
jgi:hypothetical protein